MSSDHTPEGGFCVKLVNKTGAPSVRGMLVAASTGTDNAFVAQANEYDCIGAVYDSGVADGQLCRVVVAGVAQVLLKDGTAGTRGYWVAADAVDGRAYMAASPPGGGIPELDNHMKEIGHSLQTVGSGTDVLCRVLLHFN